MQVLFGGNEFGDVGFCGGRKTREPGDNTKPTTN